MCSSVTHQWEWNRIYGNLQQFDVQTISMKLFRSCLVLQLALKRKKWINHNKLSVIRCNITSLCADMWSGMIGRITGHIITEIVGEKKGNEECENEIRLGWEWKRG